MDSTLEIAPQRSEEEIIRSVLNGHKEEYRHLVEAHQQRVFALILRQVGDIELARELTQDAFIQAYLKLQSFRFESTYSTWIIRIALNLTSSYFSSRCYKQRQRTRTIEQEELACLTIHNSSTNINEQDLALLREVISDLPTIYREVLVLSALERRKYEEVAIVLSIPVGTVRSRLNKARNLVREKYFKRGKK